MKEELLQKKICEYLAYRGHFFSRTNNVPIYDPIRKIFRKMGVYVMKGFPDIVCVVRGQFIGIEVKTPDGKVSPDQIVCKQKLEKAGGVYILARTFADFLHGFSPYDKP